MIPTNLTTLKINKLTQAQYEAAQTAGTLNENEFYLTPSREYVEAPITSVTTLVASTWDETTKTYSFESTYPVAQYDISIQPDKSCTTEQLEAYGGAMPLGSADSNVITAGGDVPTIDIPIILKVMKKWA